MSTGKPDESIPALPPAPQEVKIKNRGRLAMKLKPGFVWNPLLKLPRNMRCPCGSGKKLKACHLDKFPRAIKKELADQYQLAMRNPDRIDFIEDDNRNAVELTKNP